jgi:hypothetical protein
MRVGGLADIVGVAPVGALPDAPVGASPEDEPVARTPMTTKPRQESRLRLARDVVVFQIKCGLEAILDLTLIPVSLAAAVLDLLLGNWRDPRWFHAVLRFGERCEQRINLWGVSSPAVTGAPADVDAVIRSVEALMRNPRTGPDKIRELRRWAALKLAPDDGAGKRADPGP